MDFLSLLLPLLTGGAGALTNRQQETNSNTASQGTSSGTQGQSGTSTINGSTNPILDPDAAALKTSLASQYMKMLTPDIGGIASKGLSAIRDTTKAGVSSLKNFLSSRGLSNTAGASIGATNVLNQGLDNANEFQAQLPQMQFDNLLKSLGQAGSFFSSIPTGQNTSQTGGTSSTGWNSNANSNTSETHGVQPGNPAGGGLTGFASAMAQLYGQGAYNNAGGKKP